MPSTNPYKFEADPSLPKPCDSHPCRPQVNTVIYRSAQYSEQLGTFYVLSIAVCFCPNGDIAVPRSTFVAQSEKSRGGFVQ